MHPKKLYYENAADSLIEKFNLRSIEGYYCETKEEALLMAKRFLTPGCSISWGGSMTLYEVGLIDELKNSDYIIYDRADAVTKEEKKALYGRIVTSDFYFMSSNAITMNGELINIDGAANRVSCLCHGPDNVIILAGMNKLVPDVESGIKRVRNMAAPPNAVRLHKDIPCASLGCCTDCLKPECFCSQIVITRRSSVPNRIKVILIGEELGY